MRSQKCIGGYKSNLTRHTFRRIGVNRFVAFTRFEFFDRMTTPHPHPRNYRSFRTFLFFFIFHSIELRLIGQGQLRIYYRKTIESSFVQLLRLDAPLATDSLFLFFFFFLSFHRIPACGFYSRNRISKIAESP